MEQRQKNEESGIKFVSLTKAAEQLGVSNGTIMRYWAKDEPATLTVYRVGKRVLLDVDELNAFIAAHREG